MNSAYSYRAFPANISTNHHAMFLGGNSSYVSSDRYYLNQAQALTAIDKNGILHEEYNLPVNVGGRYCRHAGTVNKENVFVLGTASRSFIIYPDLTYSGAYSRDETNKFMTDIAGYSYRSTGKHFYGSHISDQEVYSKFDYCGPDFIRGTFNASQIELNGHRMSISSNESVHASYYWQNKLYAMVARKRDDGEYTDARFFIFKVPR